MLQSYYCYVSPISSGAVRLPLKGCSQLEDETSRIFLGSVYKSYQAMSLARRYSPNVSVCPYCMVM